jgi:hypothetical protein
MRPSRITTIADHVDTEQCLLQAEAASDGPRRGPRAEQVRSPGLETVEHLLGDGSDCSGVAVHAADLGALHQVAVVGHRQVAIELRGDAALAVQRFVDVHDLDAAPRQPVAQEAHDKLAGGARGRGVGRRVHLHARRYPDHGHRLADGGVDIARRAIPAGKQDELHTRSGHRPDRGDRVPCRRLDGSGASDGHGQAGFPRLRLAHGAGGGQHCGPATERSANDGERLARSRRRARLGAAGAGFLQHGGRIGTLQPDGAAHPGDGVDDEAELSRHGRGGAPSCAARRAR